MAAKLNPIMRLALLRAHLSGEPVTPGPTRAALSRRGLVFGYADRPERVGRLTPRGQAEAEQMTLKAIEVEQ